MTWVDDSGAPVTDPMVLKQLGDAATPTPTPAPSSGQGFANSFSGALQDHLAKQRAYMANPVGHVPPNANLALGFVGPGPGSIYSAGPEFMNMLRAPIGSGAGGGALASMAKEAAVDLPAAAAEHLGFPGAGWLTRAGMSFAKPSIDALIDKMATGGGRNPWPPLAYLAARGESAPNLPTRGILSYMMGERAKEP